MSDLSICRICLNKGVRGYKMDQYNLKQCYEQIMRAKVNEREGLPRWFCYECATMLHKYDKFKEKCFKGQLTLRQMLAGKGITYQSVSIINRYSENLISPLSLIMMNKRVKTSFAKHKPQKTEETESQDIKETIQNITYLFDDYEPPAMEVHVEGVGIKEEIHHDDNETKNHVDIQADTMSSEDVNLFSQINDKEKKTDNHDDFNVDAFFEADDRVTSDDDDDPTFSVNEEVKVKKKSSDGTVKKVSKPPLTKRKVTLPPGKKPKRFELMKKDFNPEHWHKINMTEEEALADFKQRANHSYFLKANYKCHDCLKGFSKEDMLVRHMKLAHDESLGEFVCRFCHVRFHRKSRLSIHMVEHYVVYQCRRCDQRFREKSAKMHDDIHNGVIRKCEHCGKEFKHTSTYYTHLRMTHRSAHICGLCGASFVSEVGLIKHKRITHLNSEPEPAVTSEGIEIYCEKCDIKFVTQLAYDEHLANSNMHGDTPSNIKAREFRERKKPTTCTHCGLHFPSKGLYRKHHLAEHRHIPLDPKICEVCGVAVAPSSMQQHMVTHTGERRFPCAACGKRFTQKASMQMHYKTVHLKMPYPKYPRKKPYIRKKKTPEEFVPSDFTPFVRPGYYL